MQVVPRPHTRRRGAALLLSLIAVLAVGAISATLRRVQTTIDGDQRFSIDRRAALYVAEAGIAEATLAISQGKSGAMASEEIPAAFGEGFFWVEAQDRPDRSIELRCTAQVRTAEFVLRSIIVPNMNPITSRGFFGIEGVEIGQGTLIDGFDSSNGSYDSQVTATAPHRTTGLAGRLGTLGQINLDGSSGASAESTTFTWGEWIAETPTGEESKPGGELQKGPSRAPRPQEPSPEASTGSTVTEVSSTTATASTSGSTLIHADVEGFVLSSGDAVVKGVIDLHPLGFIPPPVLRPRTVATLNGDHMVTGAEVGLGFESSVEVAGDLVVSSGASLRLNGPLVLSAEALRLEAGAQLLFDDSAGPIHVFLADGIQSGPDSALNSLAPEQGSQGTSLFVAPPEGTREHATLPTQGRFHGMLYAPGDRVVVPADLRWLGAITARWLETEPGARLSFDAALATGGQGAAATPRIASWQIVPVGDGLARRLAIDPRTTLRLQGITPVPSPTAAPETECEVILLDDSGEPTIFTGHVDDLPSGSERLMRMRWVDTRNGTLRPWLRPTGADFDGNVDAYREKFDQIRESLSAAQPVPHHLDEAVLQALSRELEMEILLKKTAMMDAKPVVK